MNTIIWKGIPSTKIDGLLICDLPPISKPPLRVKETKIDGRDGSVYDDLGYSSYTKSITIGLRGKYDINQVIKYFTGEGEIIFSNEPDKIYTAKVIDQIDYNRLLRFKQAKVNLDVQPFKHKYLETYKETQTEAITGTSIVVTNREDDILKSFSIYGKTTQNGTPTPDSPVDLVSVGAGGSIMVSATDGKGNTQTVVVQTPNGLHGIPVSRGGNYTDANGQQWICDEIDLAKGVYVQRVDRFLLAVANMNNSEEYPGWKNSGIAKYFPQKSGYIDTFGSASLSNISKGSLYINTLENRDVLLVPNFNTATQTEWKTNHPDLVVDMMFSIPTPIETVLSEEEIATYRALTPSKQTATILNDANTHMKVEYFKPFEVFNEGLETSKPIMVLRGSGSVGISVNGVHIFDYTFPDGETEVVIDSEKEDAYLGDVLKNRNMNGEFPILLAGTNKIEWSGYVESIEILPRSRWL